MNEENNSVRKRKLKVYYGHYNLRYHYIACIPMIRLRGHYLARQGFNVGDSIEVSVGVGEITIKKVGKKPPEQMKPDPP